MITIHLYLRYHTKSGQNLYATGNTDGSKAAAMHYLNEDYWHLKLEMPKNATQFHYQYLLEGEDGFRTMEGAKDRIIDFSEVKSEDIQVMDTWNFMGDYENAFLTQPFTQTLLKHTAPDATKHAKHFTHVLKVKAPLLASNEIMAVSGSSDAFGAWEQDKALQMNLEGNWYTTYVDLSKDHFPIAYKYVVWNIAENRLVRYESGSNRVLNGTGSNQVTIIHDGFAMLPNNSFKGAGVAIPVFSLRSEQSFGVGEFSDIKPLVDWGKKVGLKLIQLLPLNDTTANHTWQDSYPYAAISAFALHPIYLNLTALAGSKYASVVKNVAEKQAELNALPVVDYEAVMAAKLHTIRLLFTEMKKAWLKDKDYKAFYVQNSDWLMPYAVFCYLRDKYNTSDFKTWASGSEYNEVEAKKMVDPSFADFDNVGIHLFMQYHLHLQLKGAVDYAHANGLIMKGDIPIGIYRNSCDAWVQPELYNMDAQAGAPPDDFAVKGQNWGFPTYNWAKMQQDGFTWWKRRFGQMSLYFDAFRIDHILGFFRIWSIPMKSVEGIMGSFDPCIPVYPVEFGEKGIWFDYDRYCKPFINESILNETFGQETGRVKDIFLDNIGWDRYALKPAFDDQRKIADWFAGKDDMPAWIKQGLFDLASNVIFFDDTQNPNPERAGYHFRIEMETTSSFRYLDDHNKWQLKELYTNYYFRRQDAFWRKEAMQKLPALKASTNMLICGEDLGMVPDCVPGVMKDLGLLSLEIQRMPKDPKRQFFHPSDAPYMSVVTPSTHDMSTIRGWWEEDRATTQVFYNNELGYGGHAPYFCEPYVCRSIINQHVYSPAMWSIFQLQDLVSMDGQLRGEKPEDERINVPANPKHYWRYRMHITLETLQQQEKFNTDLHELLKASGRL